MTYRNSSNGWTPVKKKKASKPEIELRVSPHVRPPPGFLLPVSRRPRGSVPCPASRYVPLKARPQRPPADWRPRAFIPAACPRRRSVDLALIIPPRPPSASACFHSCVFVKGQRGPTRHSVLWSRRGLKVIDWTPRGNALNKRSPDVTNSHELPGQFDRL